MDRIIHSRYTRSLAANLHEELRVTFRMRSRLREFAADHQFVLDAVARHANIAEPVAIDLDEFYVPLLKAAKRGPFLPLDGLFVRDWDPNQRRTGAGMRFGTRLYEIEGIRFARIHFPYDDGLGYSAFNFIAVASQHYRRFYRIALRRRRDAEPPSVPPILPQEHLDLLWNNTIGYLDKPNLRRIKAYGGRAKRGLLLTGAPGNGKTMACRWIW